MIMFPLFWKQFGVRRFGDLNRIFSLSEINELPNLCILHLLDNFRKPDAHLIVPDTAGPLYTMNPERKILIHHLLPKAQSTDVYTEKDDLIKPSVVAVNTVLQKFRSANSRTVRIVPDMSQFIPRSGYQAIINHNHLFNVRVMGINRVARLFHYTFGSILNTVMAQPDAKHFIHVELTEALFNKTSFERLFKDGISRITLKYPNSMHYIFMAHFLSFVHSKSSASMFQKLPIEVLSNIIFVLEHRGNVAFHDLSVLKELNGSQNTILLRLIAHFNLLASGGAIDSEEIEDTVPVNQVVEQTAESETGTSESDEEPTPNKSDTPIYIEKAPENPNTPTAPDTILQPTVAPTVGKNVAVFEEPKVTQKETKQLLVEDAKTIDAAATKQATDLPDATAARVLRAKKLAVAYKNIKLRPDGPTFAELVVTPPIETVTDNRIEVLEDQVPDSSMLSSRISKLSQAYLDTTFESDLARALVSFNQHGLFLIDVTTEDEVNALNRIRHYTAKYEDTQQQTHTIRFDFPIVDRYGICRVNGVEKFFKKQRVNNPCIKSGPHRVSLATNFNKVLVERIETVANSFLPYMINLFNKAGMECVHGVMQDPKAWLFCPITNTTKNQKQYASGSVTAVVTGDTADLCVAQKAVYVRSPLGLLRITTIKPIKSLKEYDGPALSNDEQTTLAEATKMYVVTAVPVNEPKSLPYEYTVLGSKFSTVSKDALYLCFHYDRRLDQVKNADDIITKELQYGVYIGTTDGQNQCFINTQGVLTIVGSNDQVRTTTLIDEIAERMGIKPAFLSDYVILKILNTVLPIGMVMCYRFGLRYILDYLKVKYTIVHEEGMRKRIDIPPSSIVLRFKDAKLIIPRTPTVPALIMAGLDAYDLREISISEMETKDAYYGLMDQKRLSTNYLKGVDSFFDFFLDPISIDVLRQMGEPTNVLDLLIRAVALLATEDYEPASATKNSRIRSYERFVGTLYNEMAQAVATHKYRSIGAKSSISIHPLIVYKRILTDSLMENMNTINPIHDVKSTALISHLGDGGRSESTFMINDRKFTRDSIGVISEATVDSGNVAVIASASANANIQNIRGQSAGVDPEKVEPAQLLSVTSMLFPGVTYDDSQQLNC